MPVATVTCQTGVAAVTDEQQQAQQQKINKTKKYQKSLAMQ